MWPHNMIFCVPLLLLEVNMTFKPLVLGLLEYLVSSKTNSFMPEPFLIDYLPIITIW